MDNIDSYRPTNIGGQAVMEGVMMRGKRIYAMAVRKPDDEIEIIKKDLSPISDRYKILKLPILRGVVSFIDSLVTGMKTITLSAELAGLDVEEDEPSKFEKFLEKKLGNKLNDYLITISVVLAVFLAVGLFMLLPVWLGSFFSSFLSGKTWALGIIEGFLRIGIFLLYIFLISRMKEIQRVFQYHGAEHKTINCYEHCYELNVENVKKHSRYHKRCGTSFLLIVMIISMIVFLFVRTDDIVLRLASRIILVPLIAGLSYEVTVKWMGRSQSKLVDIVSFPGMLLQRMTTSEPDDKQMETAIAAMKGVLESEPPL